MGRRPKYRASPRFARRRSLPAACEEAFTGRPHRPGWPAVTVHYQSFYLFQPPGQTPFCSFFCIGRNPYEQGRRQVLKGNLAAEDADGLPRRSFRPGLMRSLTRISPVSGRTTHSLAWAATSSARTMNGTRISLDRQKTLMVSGTAGPSMSRPPTPAGDF